MLWQRAGAIAAFTFGAVFWILLLPWASDALVYRAGAVALLAGGDPWSASNAGWSYAGTPLTTLLFLPSALVAEPVFVAGWQILTLVSAVVIVRGLRLDWWWLLFPPLVAGVMLGNPAVVGMAAVVAGWPLVGLALRPHLLLVAGWRSVVAFGALSLVALALLPTYVTALPSITARYAIESGTPVTLWGSWGVVPAIVALALLWRVDRKAAAWLVMPAIGPAMGWYGFIMLMPVASLALAVAGSVPVPSVGSIAIVAYALWRSIPEHRSQDADDRLGRLGRLPGSRSGDADIGAEALDVGPQLVHLSIRERDAGAEVGPEIAKRRDLRGGEVRGEAVGDGLGLPVVDEDGLPQGLTDRRQEARLAPRDQSQR